MYTFTSLWLHWSNAQFFFFFFFFFFFSSSSSSSSSSSFFDSTTLGGSWSVQQFYFTPVYPRPSPSNQQFSSSLALLLPGPSTLTWVSLLVLFYMATILLFILLILLSKFSIVPRCKILTKLGRFTVYSTSILIMTYSLTDRHVYLYRRR